MAILAVTAIKGGIKVSSKKVPSKGLPIPESTSTEDRETVGAVSNS